MDSLVSSIAPQPKITRRILLWLDSPNACGLHACQPPHQQPHQTVLQVLASRTRLPSPNSGHPISLVLVGRNGSEHKELEDGGCRHNKYCRAVGM